MPAVGQEVTAAVAAAAKHVFCFLQHVVFTFDVFKVSSLKESFGEKIPLYYVMAKASCLPVTRGG